MKVTVEKERGLVCVTKEKGDPIFRNTGWSDAESTFLYHVKKELESRGYDCIKKRMWKDGHMVDDTQQYIRDRSPDYKWCIYNDCWTVHDAGMEFNEHGVTYLKYREFKS
jgi:hypothetical protein